MAGRSGSVNLSAKPISFQITAAVSLDVALI